MFEKKYEIYIPLTNHAEACKCKTRLTVKPAQSTNLSISDRVNSSKSDNFIIEISVIFILKYVH